MSTGPFFHRAAKSHSPARGRCNVPLASLVSLALALALGPRIACANIPGGGTGAGPDVTVTDNGDGTATMANGLVSIVIVKKTARLNAVTYTHKNGGAARTSEILLGRGQYYYGGFMLGDGVYEYSLAADPAANGGGYADARLLSATDVKGVMEVHFSMLRGSPGFYSTAIMTHRRQDAAFEVGAWGVVSRVAPDFNWLSADDKRNFFIGARSKSGVKVPDSPHEITINLDGARQGQYADKFIYGQDHADFRAWGWSSVGPGGLNVGVWMMTNMEFSNGGPLKRDVTVYPYSELNNSILTGEVGMGSDGHIADGEVWTKTCGPWFYYLNDAPAAITESGKAAKMLYEDALAQADAEKKAWPYRWFKHPNYVPAPGAARSRARSSSATPAIPMPPPPRYGWAWNDNRKPSTEPTISKNGSSPTNFGCGPTGTAPSPSPTSSRRMTIPCGRTVRGRPERSCPRIKRAATRRWSATSRRSPSASK